MLSNMNTYSQQLFTEKLHWKEKNEIVNELYEEMQSFVNDTTSVVVEYNKLHFFDMNLSDLFSRIFKKQKINKQFIFQKQEKQKQTKKYLDSNFVFVNDSVVDFVFKNKSQITEWGKNFGEFAFVQPREFYIKNSHILVLIVDCCSGLSCPYIYIFKEKGDIWELQTTSQARLTGILTVKIDNDQEKIIFEIRSGRKDNPVVEQIGELPFEVLLQ